MSPLKGKHFGSSCIFERDSLSVCSSAAPELSHGDPREGPRDPRAGGEGGFPGG